MEEYDTRIYQPEESDGKTDWPTIIGVTTAIAVFVGLALFLWYRT